MRVIIQRVTGASVEINFRMTANIHKGLLVLVGIEDADTAEDIEWVASKIINLRVFNDDEGVMNLSVKDIHGELLVVSQFTLHASTKKGNRPSYINAAKPEIAIPVYEDLIKKLKTLLGKTIETGTFGADMKIALVNDGPVTIWMDSKNKY